MKPEREQLYTALVDLRNTELQVYMQRSNIQSVLNAGFFAVIVTAGVRPESTLPAVLASSMGIMLGLIWLGFEVQGKKMFVDGWDQWIAEYERNWLRTHYNNKEGTNQGPLLFQGLIDRNALSPIHPTKRNKDWDQDRNRNPRRVTRFFTRVLSEGCQDRIERFQDSFAWENLNFHHKALPILVVVLWTVYFLYAIYLWYANWALCASVPCISYQGPTPLFP